MPASALWRTPRYDHHCIEEKKSTPCRRLCYKKRQVITTIVIHLAGSKRLRRFLNPVPVQGLRRQQSEHVTVERNVKPKASYLGHEPGASDTLLRLHRHQIDITYRTIITLYYNTT